MSGTKDKTKKERTYHLFKKERHTKEDVYTHVGSFYTKESCENAMEEIDDELSLGGVEYFLVKGHQLRTQEMCKITKYKIMDDDIY